jgi:hypothetical protein
MLKNGFSILPQAFCAEAIFDN